jgi:hypothetical protein
MTFALFALTVACGEEEITEEAPGPEVGAMELPISLRNEGPAPANAAQIVISPNELGVGGRKLIDLEAGRVPDSERSGNIITKLQSALRSGAARRSLSLRIHVNVSYETLVLVLNTAKSANINQVGFAIRKPGGADPGWLTLNDFRVAEQSEEPAEFGEGVQRTWDEFVLGWDESYRACRREPDHYVDCAPKPTVAAEGGNVSIVLFSRGSAIKAELTRFGGPPIEQAPARPALLPGLEPLPDEEEVQEPPVTDGAFTWRFAAAADELSPVSGAFRPLCGSRACGVVSRADGGTLSMRLISFIGAAFPNGTPAPHVLFELPTQ